MSLLLAGCGGGPGSIASPSTVQSAAPASPASQASDAGGDDAALDELHQQALEEGGTLVYYGVLAQENAAEILPVFEERFPGITVEHIDATGDQLVARAVAEARGGAVQGDVLAVPIENIIEAVEAELLEQWLPPEAEAYPEDLKGEQWLGIEEQYWVGAWNTDLVPADQAPDSFEDFAEPGWNEAGGLIGEPRDADMLPALVKKYDGDAERAIELVRKIAENNDPSFHKGHSDLAEMLVSGQAAACFTCYSHHFPPRQADGAPVDYFLTEGVGKPVGQGIFKNAPHPKTAQLFARWVASEEGQQVYADGGRTPTHPDVEPGDPVRPETIYHIGADDIGATGPDGRTYQEIWNEIFRLR